MSDDKFLRCSCKECGNHIEFPVQSAGTVVTCPHCGQWTELQPEAPPKTISNKTVVVLAVLLGCVVLAGAAGGFYFLRNREKTATQPPEQPAKMVTTPTNPLPAKPEPVTPAVPAKREKSPDDLKISAVELEKAKVGSLVYAIGTVTNASEFQRFGVQIELDLFGKNGKKIGIAKDYKDVIEPNREWRFHALIPDSRTVSAKVSSVKED